VYRTDRTKTGSCISKKENEYLKNCASEIPQNQVHLFPKKIKINAIFFLPASVTESN
jgi:hypothetical protein